MYLHLTGETGYFRLLLFVPSYIRIFPLNHSDCRANIIHSAELSGVSIDILYPKGIRCLWVSLAHFLSLSIFDSLILRALQPV